MKCPDRVYQGQNCFDKPKHKTRHFYVNVRKLPASILYHKHTCLSMRGFFEKTLDKSKDMCYNDIVKTYEILHVCSKNLTPRELQLARGRIFAKAFADLLVAVKPLADVI